MAKTEKHQMAYSFIKKETNIQPKIYSYPEADGSADLLVMSSGNVYGVGYCEPFSTLESMKDNESTTILQMFANESRDVNKEELEEFLEMYRDEYIGCNTNFKKEFGERVTQLEQEIIELNT